MYFRHITEHRIKVENKYFVILCNFNILILKKIKCLEMLNVIAVNAVSSFKICIQYLIYTNALSRSIKLSTFLYLEICQLFIPIYRSIPSFA